jgi:cobalamin biosynthesis protein CobT
MPVMMPDDAGDDADDAGDDAGDAGKVHSVEPEAFDDVPMSGASSIPELGMIVKGVETVAPDVVATQPLPALGRLSYELRQVLENSATDDLSRHLSAGRLSRNWSAIARGSSDVFERRNTVAGIDTAVLIAVDQSHSMAYNDSHRDPFGAIDAAAGAARMLAQVLSRCPGVAFDVRGFSSGNDFMGIDQCQAGKAKVKDEVRLMQSQAGWVVFKSFAESAGAFTRRSAALYMARRTTPEIAALADVLRLISARREQRKIVIWIGDGDGYSADAVKALQAKYPGVKVIGIGIKVDLSKCFKHSVRVNEAKDLAAVSFRTVIKAIAA